MINTIVTKLLVLYILILFNAKECYIWRLMHIHRFKKNNTNNKRERKGDVRKKRKEEGKNGKK